MTLNSIISSWLQYMDLVGFVSFGIRDAWRLVEYARRALHEWQHYFFQ